MSDAGRNRTIGVVTSARSDFGLLLGLLRAIVDHPRLDLVLYVTGMHHSREHGHTIDEVRACGFASYIVNVPSFQGSDTAQAIAASMAAGLGGFASEFGRARPDILVILGDRYDSYPAAMAALPFAIPVAHISGGELTQGAIDDAIRHCFTKLSHLHFPSHPDFARRLRQMGEEPWRIVLSGQPGLDALRSFPFLPRDQVIAGLGLDPAAPVSILTFHPETLHAGESARDIAELVKAAALVRTQLVMTAPNADTGNDAIRTALTALARTRSGCVYRENLGRDLYLNVLNHADCMVGNSSSGLIEAASFKLPVVNIGDRQKGRLAPENVIHCPTRADDIATAWNRALSAQFRQGLATLENPYGDGRAVSRIVSTLVDVPLDEKLIVKGFVDWSEPQ